MDHVECKNERSIQEDWEQKAEWNLHHDFDVFILHVRYFKICGKVTQYFRVRQFLPRS